MYHSVYNICFCGGGTGKNLQICFMNETASDNESQASDLEHNLNCNSNSSSRSSLFSKNSYNHPYQTRPLSVNITKHEKNPPTGKCDPACNICYVIIVIMSHSYQINVSTAIVSLLVDNRFFFIILISRTWL